MLPPHQVWTHDLVPQHSQEDIHPVSWCPMKYRRLAWHKWLFDLQSRHGYSHYATFWRDDPPPSHLPAVPHAPQPQCTRFVGAL